MKDAAFWSIWTIGIIGSLLTDGTADWHGFWFGVALFGSGCMVGAIIAQPAADITTTERK